MIKLSRSISNRIMYRFTTASYPYKFGGIDRNPYPSEFNYIFESIFDRETLQGFKFAYVEVLKALRDKDSQFLKNIMQKNLIDKANLIDVELLHETSHLDVSVGKSFISVGGKFERDPSNSVFNLMGRKNPAYDIYMSLNLLNGTKMEFPILFGFEIYLSGPTKLVKPSDKQSSKDGNEHHMLQFEISNSLNIMTLMPMLAKMQNIKQTEINNSNLMKQAIKSMMGKDYEWKIGDIDKILNRNFKEVQGGGPFNGLTKF